MLSNSKYSGAYNFTIVLAIVVSRWVFNIVIFVAWKMRLFTIETRPRKAH